MKSAALGRDALRQLLAEHYLFSPLSAEQLESLVEHARVTELPAGKILFHQDDAAERFYLVASGQIKLFRLSPTGQEKVVEIMSAGQTFAEAVMFMQHGRYPVSTEALVDSLVVGLPNRDYLRLLGASPEACFQLLGKLSQRLHLRLKEIDTLTLQNAGYRVAHYLSSLLPANAAPGIEIALPLPKQVIASRLSIQPETLSRVLLNLSNRGIATASGRTVTVHDPVRLRDFS